MTISIKALSGSQARQYWQEIANLRIGMFREFPYLYEGSLEYEKPYLETYFKSENSAILLVFDENEVVGFSSAIPLSEEMPEIQAPFIAQNLNTEKYLYIGEVMLLPEYRGRGMLRKFLQYQENFALGKGCEYTVFMTVWRPQNHPSIPVGYKHLEPVWEHFSYKRMEGMGIEMHWQQVDTHKKERNTLEVWHKKL